MVEKTSKGGRNGADW